MFKLSVNSSNLLLAVIFIFSSHAGFAETPLDTMMKKSSEMMKAGQEAAQKSMDSAIEKAKADAEEAMSKLPSYSINTLTQDGDPAEPSKDFKWTPETIKLANEGDIKLGEELAKKGKCSKCHGDTGVSEEDDTPSIAGQITAYSFKQLHDYKVELRENKQMLKKVKNLSPKDMADISAYYATQTAEEKVGAVDGAEPPVLAVKGDPERFMLACDSCHNDESQKRGYQTPRIDGQKIEYFVDTMTAFQEGDRVNDHYSLMRGLAAKLTEDEIDELASYYSAKPVDDDD